MAYIGSSAAVTPVAFSGVNAQSFNGDGSTVAFTLNRPVSSVAAIEVVVNNVQQSPYDGSYSVNDTTLTFSAAPSTGTGNIYVVYRDFPVGSITDPNTYTKTQTDTLLAGRVAKTGDTMTGNLEIQSSGGSQLKVHKTGVTTLGVHPAIDLQLTQTNTQSALLGQISGEFISGWGGDLILSTKPANGTPDNNVISRMRIDSAGRVTMPYQPAFSFGGLSTSLGLTTSPQRVVFTGQKLNRGSHYASGVFTAPVAGAYAFMSHALCLSNGNAFYSIRVNGTDVNDGRTKVEVSNVEGFVGVQIIYPLAAGDTVEIVAWRDGAAGTIYQGFCGFSGHLIG